MHSIDDLNGIICGALRDCIGAHGPITKELVGSASKRVIGVLRSYRPKDIADAASQDEILRLQRELNRKIHRIKVMNKTVWDLRKRLGLNV